MDDKQTATFTAPGGGNGVSSMVTYSGARAFEIGSDRHLLFLILEELRTIRKLIEKGVTSDVR